ncbi:chorismate mutase [Lactococcus ileimucosae]|uniref:Chorismate mutase n=1 Tax=Lactococcus ileimucosae TaxID=2941329 RepID=A0ABV4D297_9LACT|nr:chorismate mutase [Lactococcus ileimucosae]
MTLENIRKEIDALDEQILALLDQRMFLVEKVIAAKAQENLQVLDAAREKFILEKIEKKIKNPQYAASIQSIYKEIMKQSRDYQEKNGLKNKPPKNGNKK